MESRDKISRLFVHSRPRKLDWKLKKHD